VSCVGSWGEVVAGTERSDDGFSVGEPEGSQQSLDERLLRDPELPCRTISGDSHPEEVANLAVVGDPVLLVDL
jgi:hypothetical protein